MFTREDTKAMKGIAVIIMLLHHLFVLPDRLPIGYSYNEVLTLNGMDFYTMIGNFCYICVPIFMFLGGYGLYKKFKNNQTLIDSIKSIYINYWKVFIIFISIAFIFFSSQPDYLINTSFCNRYSVFNIVEFFENFVGYSCTYNGEWWFLRSYIITLIWGTIFIKILDKQKSFWLEFIIIILLYILTQNIFPNIISLNGLKDSLLFNLFFLLHHSSLCLLMGTTFAKYNIFEIIFSRLAKYSNVSKCLISIFGICIIFILKVFTFGNNLDIILIPMFIVCCQNIFTIIKPLKKILIIFGNNSTNMWLMHSFYCYYFYECVKLLYWTNNGILVGITLVIVSLLSSIILNKFYDLLHYIYKKLYKIITNKRLKV